MIMKATKEAESRGVRWGISGRSSFPLGTMGMSAGAGDAVAGGAMVVGG